MILKEVFNLVIEIYLAFQVILQLKCFKFTPFLIIAVVPLILIFISFTCFFIWSDYDRWLNGGVHKNETHEESNCTISSKLHSMMLNGENGTMRPQLLLLPSTFVFLSFYMFFFTHLYGLLIYNK